MSSQTAIPFVRKNILVSLVSLSLVLVAGVFARELTRFSDSGLSADQLQHATLLILLAHGHAFILLCVVPALFAGSAAFIGRNLLPGVLRQLQWSTGLYYAGSALTVSLILYRGIMHLAFFTPAEGFSQAETILFGGSPILRTLFYGISHPIMGIGLVWTAWLLARATWRRE